jgi:hypothetical protein
VTEDIPRTVLSVPRGPLVDLFHWDRHAEQWRWGRFATKPCWWLQSCATAISSGALMGSAHGRAATAVGQPTSIQMLGLTLERTRSDRRFLVELSGWSGPIPPTPGAPDGRRDRIGRGGCHRRTCRSIGAAGRRARAAAEGCLRRGVCHGTSPARLRIDRDEAPAERADGRVTGSHHRLEARIDQGAGFRRRFDRADTRSAAAPARRRRPVMVRGATAVCGAGAARRDTVVDSPVVRCICPSRKTWCCCGDCSERAPYAPAKPAVRDWGTRWLSQLWVSGGPDVGLFAGSGVSYTRFGFRQDPYASRYVLRAGYATGASTGRADFRAEWRRPNSRVRYGLFARASGIEVMRFNGFGNEIAAEGEDEFYRVNDVDLTLAPWISLPVARQLDLRLGPLLRYSDTDFDEPRFIALERPYGSGSFGMVGAVADLRYDGRNRPTAATHGVVLGVGGSYYPVLLDVEEQFGELHAEGAVYLTADSMPLQPTLALRAGGKQVWGEYPFRQAAFIGDASTVRLGWQNRYAGDASVYGNVELRLRLSSFNVLVPGDFGVFGLGDVGRVYLDGETPTSGTPPPEADPLPSERAIRFGRGGELLERTSVGGGFGF